MVKKTQAKTSRRKKTAKKAAQKTAGKTPRKAVGKAARKGSGASRGKRARKSASRKGSGPCRPHRSLRLLLGGLVLGALLLGAYTLYLGQQVRVAFDGKRWSVPARVYARPLELFVGARLSEKQLSYELEILGYRKVRALQQAGQWSRNGSRFHIATRGFRYWDGYADGARLSVEIDAGTLARLQYLDSGEQLDLVRLEPAMIGSIYPAHREDRVLVKRDRLPIHLVQALLAVEDRRFHEHFGLDPRGIARAAWSNLRAGGVVQGGSTLTQQLVKNFLLDDERSLWRKFNEALMALIVEARYSKDEILEAYANEIYLGQDGARAIHGFGLAAYFYFNRPLEELRLHETALLVGLVKGASFYNPRRHPQRAKQRRDLVIGEMREAGFVDQVTANQARARPLEVSAGGRRQGHRYPGFVQLVRRQLRRDYRDQDLTSEGLRIFTTLDPWDQHQASSGLAQQLQSLENSRRLQADSLQGALVLVDPQGGEVTALVGGRDAAASGFNRALDARRPIGSLVKPAVYLTALAQPRKYSLASVLEDAPVDLEMPNGDRWQPQNYDKEVHGKLPLHRALSDSLNLATVNLGMDLGLDRVLDTLRALGAHDKIPAYPSLLLGALPMAPLQVAQLYQTLASGGFRAPLRAIREVTDSTGEPLQRYGLEVRQTMDASAVFLLTANLREVVENGTGRGLQSWLGQRALAGKTGTTDDLRDSWFAGFGGDRVGVVWVGRDDNKPTGLTGASGALPVFGRVMQRLDIQALAEPQPADVIYRWVDRQGRLSAEGCEGAYPLPFIQDSWPALRSSCGERSEEGLLERLFEWR